jgi:hypothetical protein
VAYFWESRGTQYWECELFHCPWGVYAFDGFRDTKRAGFTNEVTVPATTIDAECEFIQHACISTIKRLVEGAELEVLQGALKSIDQECFFVLVEWSISKLETYHIEAEQLLISASSIGYQVFSASYLS